MLCGRLQYPRVMKRSRQSVTSSASAHPLRLQEWKYVVRSTHPDNPNTKGTVSADGKVRTAFEEDVKVRARSQAGGPKDQTGGGEERSTSSKCGEGWAMHYSVKLMHECAKPSRYST